MRRGSKRNQPERSEQATVAEWLRQHDKLFSAIPVSGSFFSRGMRKTNYDAGYEPGTPDFTIYEPRGEHLGYAYHGLLIEMKANEKWKVSHAQRWYLERARERGYLAVVCRGSSAAITLLEWYFGLHEAHSMSYKTLCEHDYEF